MNIGNMKNILTLLSLKSHTKVPISPYVTIARLIVVLGSFFLLCLWSEAGDSLWVFYVICFLVLGLSMLRHLLIKVPFEFGSSIDSLYFVATRVFVLSVACFIIYSSVAVFI